ncbi:MAG TPA: tetratricopeptide repeat protein [Cyclobacteriaceae bacterium]
MIYKYAFRVLAISFIISSTYVMGQPGWNWPDEIDIAKEKNALYTDNLKQDNCQKAKEAHQWLLEKAPDLHVSLYQNGTKIYKCLAENTSDEAKKKEYQEKALEMYEKRIEYFGKEGYVLNRKAFDAYKFYKDDREKYQELYNLFKRTYDVNGAKVYDNNLVAFMDVIRRYKKTGGDISDVQVIDDYTTITDIIDEKKATGKDLDRLDKITENIDKLLTATIDVDCEFVENNLGPKMKETQDLKMAKKVFQLLLTGKCSDSPLFVESAKMVHEKEPAFGLAKVIAIKEGASGNTEEALKYYNEAVELSDDNIKQGEIFLNMAKLYASKGQKVAARSSAQRAVASDPSLKEAYSLIGNLYMGSFEDCKQGISKSEDRAVFIAAYNMYRRAGDSEGMSSAKAQFPSKEEIFTENKEKGETLTIGCWINETVTLDTRD